MSRPHLLYLAWGFPPASKSCTYRMLATANSFNRAGWRVTVLTLSEDAWLREHGLDDSLLDLVDPEIEVERLPLYRDDLETDIRTYSRLRAQRPKQWLKWHRRQDQRQFPEPVFGRWRDQLVEATRGIHDRDPVDLLLTSAAPYTFFAPALDLWEHAQVPFVLDYRDAWSIDIINDVPAFAPTSRKGRFEQRLMAAAHEAWFVNSPIRDAYAELYPARARDLHVVMNGSDVAVGTNRIPLRHPDPDEGLTFGYLGTVTFSPDRTRLLCEGWRRARSMNEALSRSQLVFRGHIGAGSARGANAHSRVISNYAADGVRFDGPAAKAETAAIYSSWDALLLCLVGGRYVTSGKVFDYISTGLPVMSAHEREHAAVEILRDYPLWVPNDGLDVDSIARAFVRTAELAGSASVEDREKARQFAERYERYAQIEPAVARLSSHFGATFGAAVGTDQQGLTRLDARDTSDRGTADSGPPAADPELSPLAQGGPEPEGMIRAERPAPVPHADNQLVAICYTAAPMSVVTDAVKSIRARGGRVALIGPMVKGYEVPAAAADEYVKLVHRAVPVPFDRANPPKRYSRQWVSIVARNLTRRATVRPAQRLIGASTLWWVAAHQDREASRVLDHADVICAADAGAVYLVWEAARRNRHAAGINGIGPTMEHLGFVR